MAQTSLRSILRRSALLQRWRFLPFTATYALARMVRPVRADRILFLSDSRAGFSGNVAFLREEILRQEPNAEVIGIFKPRLRARRPLADIVRLPWLVASAHTIVLDDLYPLIYPSRIRSGTRLLQVWHAAGAFKRVGYSREGLPGGPARGTLAHRNYTDATVSAESIRGDYAEAFAIPVDRVHAAGVPRTDAFFDEATVTASAAAVRERYGLPDSSKIALFAPTFRGNGQLTAHFDYDSVDWDELGERLGPQWTVLVKMHPFVPSLRSARPGVTKVVDVSDDREITELMMAADVLVTDYSSAIFEFALLGRPIVFFCPDLEQYTADRDFYYPFEQYVTGPVVRASSELADAVATATVQPSAAAFLERFMGACDGHSSERIVRDVILRRPAPHADVAPVAPGGSAPAPTRANSRMRVWLAAATLARLGVSLVYAPLKLLPLQRKVVMISREHPTVPADFADIADALRRLDPTIRVMMLVKMMPPGIIAKIGYAFHMLRQIYHVATARVLVVDTYAIVASVPRHRPELTVIQIWHALGAFKKFGLSILGQDEGRDVRLASAMRMHEGYDLVLASSEDCRPAYAEAFGTPLERVKVAPLPRVDHLRDAAQGARTASRIYGRHPHLRDARVVVFAPTFRLDGTVTTDPLALSKALAADGFHLVVKLHPLMSADFGAEVDTAAGFTTQELLHVADAFVTDYSSVLYEAAIVGVPSYFLVPDLDDYLAARDFYLDYRHDLPGPIVRTVSDLVTAVRTDVAKPADAAAFAERWVQVPRADASNPHGCADHIARLVAGETDR